MGWIDIGGGIQVWSAAAAAAQRPSVNRPKPKPVKQEIKRQWSTLPVTKEVTNPDTGIKEVKTDLVNLGRPVTAAEAFALKDNPPLPVSEFSKVGIEANNPVVAPAIQQEMLRNQEQANALAEAAAEEQRLAAEAAAAETARLEAIAAEQAATAQRNLRNRGIASQAARSSLQVLNSKDGNVNGGAKAAAGSPVKRKKKRSGLRINRPTSGGGTAGLNIAN